MCNNIYTNAVKLTYCRIIYIICIASSNVSCRAFIRGLQSEFNKNRCYLIDLINDAKKAGKMILLTTHVLETARRAIERYVVLNNGVIMLDGSLESIKDHYEIKDDNFGELYQKLSVEQVK